MTEALRHWEQSRDLRKKQCDCFTYKMYNMKKLKKFALNDARVLSREELASIEGSLHIDALDNCTMETKGKACIYYISTDSEGRDLIVLGTCAVRYDQFGSSIFGTPYCA